MTLPLPWPQLPDPDDPEFASALQQNFERLSLQFPVAAHNTLEKPVRGIVDSAAAISEGSGFTVATPSTGLYTITFSPAFADIPSVVAIPREGDLAATVRHNVAATASSCQLATRTTAGALANSGFHFIAIGPR